MSLLRHRCEITVASLWDETAGNEREDRHGEQIDAHVPGAVRCREPGGDEWRDSRTQDRRHIVGDRRTGVTHVRGEQLGQECRLDTEERGHHTSDETF